MTGTSSTPAWIFVLLVLVGIEPRSAGSVLTADWSAALVSEVSEQCAVSVTSSLLCVGRLCAACALKWEDNLQELALSSSTRAREITLRAWGLAASTFTY